MPTKLVFDTNFMIAGFQNQPQLFTEFARILKSKGYELYITNYIQKEMLWYLRRSITPHVKLHKISDEQLKDFIKNALKTVKSLPQPPDMSVILAGQVLDARIVSSDLKLVEVAEKLGVAASMNSAFVAGLLETIEDPSDKNLLENLYNRLFTDEISYSVKGKEVYDPVQRIQKIVESTVQTIKKSTLKDEPTILRIEDFPDSAQELAEELHEHMLLMRTNIDKYISEFEKGNYELLENELREALTKFKDLLIEINMIGDFHDSFIFKESIILYGYLMLLRTALSIGLQDVNAAKKWNDELFLLLLQSKELTQAIEMEFHLQRIIVLLITKDLERLRAYFTPTFMQKCIDTKRDDLSNILNIISILSIILKRNQVEPAAIPKSYEDVEFILQIAFQFIAAGKLEESMLLLEQAYHMAINGNMVGVGIAILEYMAPINLALNGKYSKKMLDLFHVGTEVESSLKSMNLQDRIEIGNKPVPKHLIIKSYVKHNKLPADLLSWFDVLDTSLITFKQLGTVNMIRVVDWNNKIIIGILDRNHSLPESIGVASLLKINQGYFMTLIPSKSLREKRKVDLFLIPAENKTTSYLLQRVGNITISHSKEKIAAYDL